MLCSALCFFRTTGTLRRLGSAREATESTAFQERFDLALEALQKGDPFPVFRRGIMIAENIWDLDKNSLCWSCGGPL